jgi:actin-like ATPase involved in cell morphogenesis
VAWFLGIDLGTTFTAAAAVVGADGRPRVVSLGDHGTAIPSVLLLREDGQFLVGDAAVRRALDEPSRVARESKRRVGDPVPFMLGGTPYAAELLQARLLRWVVDRMATELGARPDRIAVTYPASWGAYKLDLLRSAVRQVDLVVDLYVPEPVAAATSYAAERPVAVGGLLAVYDLGGGTFDCCVVRRDPQGFEVVGTPEGIERLGGIDFDEAVLDHVRRNVGTALDDLDADDPAAVAALAHLRRECREAKEVLSADADAAIGVLLPGVTRTVRITRGELEAMIRPALAETVVALRRAVRTAAVSADDLDAVLLVGGSSRIPLVSQLVAAELGRPVVVDAHPKDAVALGAVIALAGSSGAAAWTVAPAAEPEVAPFPVSTPEPAPEPTPEPEPEIAPEIAPDASPGPPPAATHEPEGAAVPEVALATSSDEGGGRRWARLLLPVGAVVVLVAAVLGIALAGGDGGDGSDGSEGPDFERDSDGPTFAIEGETITGFEELGGGIERDLTMSAGSMLIVRGQSTADLVISVLVDEGTAEQMLDSKDALAEVSDVIITDLDEPFLTSDTVDRDGVSSDIAGDLPTTVIADEDETTSGEEEVLGIPFLNQTEITVLLTNYEGEEGTIDARIDVVPIDTTGDPEDFVTAVQESTRIQVLWPELSFE